MESSILPSLQTLLPVKEEYIECSSTEAKLLVETGAAATALGVSSHICASISGLSR